MEPIEYVRALRRRWAVLAASVLVALVAGWFAGGTAGARPRTTYEARAVLLATAPAGVPGVSNISTMAALATVGEVPVRAARELGERDPLALAKKVQAAADPDLGILTITATEPSPGRAAAIANAFARQLVAALVEGRARSTSAQLAALTARLDQLQSQIADLDRRLGGARGSEEDILRAQRDALIRQYGATYEQYQQVAPAAAAPGPPLEIVQQATPERTAVRGLRLPDGRAPALGIAAALGLALGAALALVLERLDRRIRTKRAAETHFGIPVVAEIPPLARRYRRHPVAAVEESPGAGSFRLLAAAVAHAPGNGPASGNGGRPPGSGRAILVTSAAAAEGKTTVAAGLAVALARSGKRVLLLSCDFRNPGIHRLFRVPNEQGLADALRSPNGARRLARYLQATPIEELAIVPSGADPEGAGELLASRSMRRILEEAVTMADLVVVDSAPVLAGDTAPLVEEVDEVLLVARAGATTPEEAERAGEMLKRLGTPVIGVALNCATDVPVVGRGRR